MIVNKNPVPKRYKVRTPDLRIALMTAPQRKSRRVGRLVSIRHFAKLLRAQAEQREIDRLQGT